MGRESERGGTLMGEGLISYLFFSHRKMHLVSERKKQVREM